ncbi:hypothetical protein PRUPE_1G347800, partial [Prunus persica]
VRVSFNCGGDICTCCIACFLPCITFGQIAEVVDEGQKSCLCHCILYVLFSTYHLQRTYSSKYRGIMRKKFGLPEEPCWDCCVHCLCEPCALSQEYAELKFRGFNPSKGWTGPPTAAPQVPPSMTK